MRTSLESKIGEQEFDLEQTWDFGTTSNSQEFASEAWSYHKHENYNLELYQKTESPSDRPTIPATIKERLAYFRCYVSSPFKTQIIPLQLFCFNTFVWNHIFTLFMKSLPTSYITLFLSSFASRDHFYLSKMIPLFSGSSIAIVICGVFELTFYIDYIAILLYYTVSGYFYKSPWFGCDIKVNFTIDGSEIKCITPNEFAEIFANKTAKFETRYNHVTPKGEMVLTSPEYFYGLTMAVLKSSTSISLLYLRVLIIIAASLYYKALFKRFIWRFMDTVHLVMNIIYVAVSVHLTYSYLEGKMRTLPVEWKIPWTIALKMDPNLMSESITAPPVLHVITSRSSDQIRPGRDSGILMASNTIYFILRGVLTNRLNKYCESVFNVLLVTAYSSFPDFVLFPLYFSTLMFGNVYSLIYFTTSFLMELITFIITYQCLLEAIVCEWPKLKRWMIIVSLNIITLIVMYVTSDFITRFVLSFVSKSITSLVEIIVICFFYPLGRLIDDITFHLGTEPLDIRVLSFKILPFYYTVKIYFAIGNLLHFVKRYVALIWCLILSPVSLGLIYNLLKHILLKKKHCKDLLRPVPGFGPQNHLIRQLRKHYDGREFITSQSPRVLSRYIIAKSEADTYKLDIRYAPRRSTLFRSPEMHFESDKIEDGARRRSASARRDARVL